MPLHRALVLFLIVAFGVNPAQGELPEGYHKAIDGLASRLVAESTYEEGSPIFLCLDVFNDGDAAAEVVRGAEWRLKLMDVNGSVLTPRKPTQAGLPPKIAPGKQRTMLWFYVSGNEHAIFEPLKHGRYRAVWPGPEEQADYLVPQPPESNTVTFEVVPKKDVRPVPGSEVGDVPWGKEKGGLQTRIRATNSSFYAGTPVPVVVEMKNVSQKTLYYDVPQVAINGRVRVLHDGSAPAPYIASSAQTCNPRCPVKPGETVTLDEFDLTEYHFVQKPGRYALQYPGCKAWGNELADPGDEEKEPADSDIPATNVFEVQILGTAIADPLERAVAPLVERCPNDWQLVASRSPSRLDQPGGQWGRVPCRHYAFNHRDVFRNGLGRPFAVYPVTIWIATQKAVLEPWDLGKWDGTEWKPEEQEEQEARLSDYLGLSPFGHVYLGRLHKTSLERWPTAKEDIIRWLRVK